VLLPGPVLLLLQVAGRNALAITTPNGRLAGNRQSPEYHGNRRQPSMRALLPLPRPPLARAAALAGSVRSRCGTE
jgi:hypothetical protein